MEQIELVDFINKAEQDQILFDFRVTTMDFKESDKSNELDKFRKFKSSGGTEPDKCSLIWEIYQKLWDIDDKNREAYTGDTMNSVMRTLNKHLKINENKVSKRGEEFLSVSYTIGNFIPVPAKTDDQIMSFNQQRNSCYAQDYWDRTLYCIYRWYMDNPNTKNSEENDQWLKKLLLGSKKRGIEGDATVTACKRWLKAFHDKKGNPSWDAFVEKNYLQDYTLWSTWPYGPPKEFWEGHFPEGPKKLSRKPRNKSRPFSAMPQPVSKPAVPAW